jgi:hypothetical protein
VVDLCGGESAAKALSGGKGTGVADRVVGHGGPKPFF